MAKQDQVIQFRMRVPVEVKHSGDWFIASCSVLDVHSQGTTEKEAIANLTEALQLFVESCYERGVLEQVLKECGFEPASEAQLPSAPQKYTIEVPLPLVSRRAQARAG
jgi:predicted RNase H-like HicB family nuclease